MEDSAANCDLEELENRRQFRAQLKEAVMGTVAADGIAQLSLSDTLFPPVRRADVPMVRISISGTIELTQEQYQAFLDGTMLGPGAVVEVTATGYVVAPAAAWVRRKEEGAAWWEPEGRVKVKLTDLGRLAPTGEEWDE